MTENFLPHSVEKSILRLFEDLATPLSLKVSILWRYGEWDQIALCDLEPKHYLDADRFWRDAMATSIVRKLENLPTTFDKKKVAEDTFLACEQQCFRTNLRLLPYLSPGLPDTELGVLSYIKRARKICQSILGPCPDTHEVVTTREGTNYFKVRGRFGPGATYGDRGRFTTIPDKMSSEPTLTTGGMYYLLPWADTLWAKACKTSGRDPLFVQGNRFTTVPKDCKRFRGIAVEPSINLYFQLGFGSALRARLRAVNLDLTKGQDIHRRIAREASIRGHLCTLDLSNASDTICSNLVKLLLPSSWHSALNDLRSHKTLFQGEWHLLEKFSSMGNGFTFELETLIFLCLIMASDPLGQKLKIGENVFVFGDDLIFPTESANDVIAALSFFGMSVNKSKSFVDGPFRESCGGDYFNGVDVRPYFMKESPSEPQHLISLVNGLRRASQDDPIRNSVVNRAWLGILDGLPSSIRRLRGPQDLGDLCIHDVDESRWQVRHRSCIRWIRVYRPAKFTRVSYQNFKPDVILASAVYGTGSPLKGIIPRDGVLGYKIGWVARS